MNKREAVAKAIPQPVLNTFLLAFPSLYKTSLISYEMYLSDAKQQLINLLLQTEPISGNIVEFGSARCGTSTFIGSYLKNKGIKKQVFALDTFGRGFDPDELERERGRGFTAKGGNAFTKNSFSYVQQKIKALHLQDYVIPIQGLFQNTFPKINSRYSLVIVDCDLSESVEFALESAYPLLYGGGIIAVDDYGDHDYQGVKFIVDRFIELYRNEISATQPYRLVEIRKLFRRTNESQRISKHGHRSCPRGAGLEA